jgi:hypothetical protein
MQVQENKRWEEEGDELKPNLKKLSGNLYEFRS